METTRQLSPAAVADGDYEAIEAAVMETERGRWFLAEFAHRNRAADTAKALAAVQRLELLVGTQSLSADHDEFVDRLATLRGTIARAAIDAGLGSEGTPGESASPGADATRQAAEAATARIRKAADHISEIADRLKDQRPDLVERLETSMVQIHSAAALHDLSTQRLLRLATALKTIETQVAELSDFAARAEVRPAATGTMPAPSTATAEPVSEATAPAPPAAPAQPATVPAKAPAATGTDQDEVLFFVRPPPREPAAEPG